MIESRGKQKVHLTYTYNIVVIHTSFTRSKLKLNDLSVLKFHLPLKVYLAPLIEGTKGVKSLLKQATISSA